MTNSDLANAIIAAAAALAAGLGRLLPFDPAVTLQNTVAPDARFVLGAKYIYADREFRYVRFKNDGGGAYALGQNLFPGNLYGLVTNDVAGGAAALTMYAGTCLGVQTGDYYGFVQTGGPGYVLHNNDDDAAIGSEVILTAADTGVANVGAQTLLLGIGVGLVAVVAATNLQLVQIKCKFW
jgi:hypothetical protein